MAARLGEASHRALHTMYPFFRRYLFAMDPERAHQFTLGLLRLAGAVAPARWMLELLYSAPARPVTVFGLTFRNPIGLAAGYDKDGIAVRGLAALGFGHIEVGTVTPLPQPGNPQPRLFRLVEDEALINRLGFPSRGSAYVQRRLDPGRRGHSLREMIGARHPVAPGTSKRSLRHAAGCVIGVNIGRNKSTPNERAAFDYLELLQNFAPHADYLTVNVSSPNTPGLRDLQEKAALADLLERLVKTRDAAARRPPLLLKIAPDLDDVSLAAIVDTALTAGIEGMIVSNTTTARIRVKDPQAGWRTQEDRRQGSIAEGRPQRAR